MNNNEFELIGGPFDGQRRTVREGNRLMIQMQNDDEEPALLNDGDPVPVPERTFAIYEIAGPGRFRFVRVEARVATDLLS